MMKLGLIGVGKVGSQILTDIQYLNLFSDIVVIDTNEALARGEILDHQHAQGLKATSHIRINCGDYQDLVDADVVVVTASIATDPNLPDRTALTKGNVEVVTDVMNRINAVTQQPLIVIVSNPVDTMTYVATQVNDYPNEKIMGTGTLLESARFRTLIANHYDIDPKSVEAFVIGEHGQHAVPVWSKVTIAGMLLDEFEVLSGKPQIDRKVITQQIDKVSFDVFRDKGWTNVAIAKTTVELVKSLVLNEKSILPLTSLTTDGRLAISLPTLVTRQGIGQVYNISLDTTEFQQFEQAQAYIQKTIDTYYHK
ncbi:lactate/malate family dehydrogenase [Staphylococcus americanisciuri]|uniref:Lactate dehydrogenase n=1 Tax=Staphylococcus americanisciuri TaxID=2973940 RepID=A0ABT2F1R4_9STAP|nr:lactate dehydrogenase [Staphylococcus americanisciuri]MCS4486088.1 lactate dehydrogenase [Staphylococcus americanisciuri]